jgi:hypothetical protein
MRWGSGTLRWIRPLKRILCLFDGKVVPFDIDGIRATRSPRATASSARVSPSSSTTSPTIARKLEADYVLLDVADRKLKILEAAKAVTAAKGLALVDDDGCWTRSRVWPNGRPPSWATWTPVPQPAARGGPAVDEGAPEVFRGPRSGQTRPRPELRRRRQCRGLRRRRGPRRRQQPRAVRPPERRPLLLGRGPQDRLRRLVEEAGRRHLPRQARHARRTRRPHRRLGP